MKIEVLVGMIGSGKSTYARQRADDGAMIVCHDDLLAMLHGKYRYSWHDRACYRRMEEALVLTAISEKNDVVIDRTGLVFEARNRWLEFVDDHRRIARRGVFNGFDCVELVAVVFPIEQPEVHALRRFESDPRNPSRHTSRLPGTPST